MAYSISEYRALSSSTGTPRRMQVVEVGQLDVTERPDTVLVTYALGSCVGLGLWDPTRRVAALAHIQLPDSSMDEAKARNKPGMFADTAVSLLVGLMRSRGVRTERVVAHVAGAAQLLGDRTLFDVGRKNRVATLNSLRSFGIVPMTDETGGREPRTVYLEAGTGEFSIRVGAGQVVSRTAV